MYQLCPIYLVVADVTPRNMSGVASCETKPPWKQ